MEKLLAHIRATLEEEKRLVSELMGLSLQTRQAILNRSIADLNLLGARQDNILVRLDITRQTQTRLLKSQHNETGVSAASFEELVSDIGSGKDLEIIKQLGESIRNLRNLNLQNARLLDKHMTSLRAFGQVLELVRGVEKVYNRDGTLRQIRGPAQIEEMR